MQQRTWIYTLTEKLSENQAQTLMAEVQAFLAQWQSHGTPVAGTAALHYGQFLILQAAPDGEMPSGCSRDSLNRGVDAVIRQQGLRYHDAGMVAWKQADGSISLTSFREIGLLLAAGTLTQETLVLDNTLGNSDDLTRWETPLRTTWMQRLVR